MSESYIDTIRKTKERLDKVSPTFCMAKWSMVTIHLQQGETHSCYHPWTHKIPKEEIKVNPSALHNTSYKKEQRKLMLEGKRPSECQYCWNIEDLKKDYFSDRMIRSNELWNKADFEHISKSPWDADINPRHVEMSFDSVCQLKCAYCNPTVSTKWLEEVKTFGGYKTSNKFNDYMSADKILEREKQISEPNPFVEAFWKWWPSLYPDLRVFRLTGGEPLLSKETFRLLDYIVENPHPNLELIINSNLSVNDGLIDRLIEKSNLALKKKNIKSFTVFASIDTYGEQAEYIRTGLNYQKFMSNVRKILDHVEGSQVAFTVTFNALSVPRFKLLLNEILELRKIYHSVHNTQRLLFDTPYLRFPDHLSIQTLPKEYSKYFDEQIEFMKAHQEPIYGFSELEIMKIHRIRDWMLSADNVKAIEIARNDFAIYFKEHDRRRNTDFCKTFPELADFYKSLDRQML